MGDRAMTREEAHLEYNTRKSWSQEASIDAIYDDFESRICENCKWFREILEDGKGYGSEWVSCSEVYAETNNYSPKDFGCLKFERKQNEN